MSDDKVVKSYAQSEAYPYGYHFQLYLLAIAFREPKFLSSHEFVVKPSYFESEEFRHIAKILQNYFSRYGRVPDLDLARDVLHQYCIDNKLSEKAKKQLDLALEGIAAIDITEDIEWVKDQAIQFAQAKSMKQALIKAVKSIDDPSKYGEILSDIERSLEIAAPRTSIIKFSDVALDIPTQLREHSMFAAGRRIKTGLPTLDDHMFGGAAVGKIGVVMSPSGYGKQVADNTPVLTTNGWKKHGDLVVGDYVFGINGLPIKVLATTEKTPSNIRVELADGSVIYCHENHEWLMFDRSASRRCWRVIETKKMLNAKGKIWDNRARFQLPIKPAISFEDKELLLEPYALGVWLGDGTTGKPVISHAEFDVEHIMEIENNFGFTVSNESKHKGTGVMYSYFSDGFRGALGKIGVLKNKHIPEIYLRASLEQRLRLLAGIIDTDGYVERDGRERVTIVSTVGELADNIVELVRSFGWRVEPFLVGPKLSTSGIQGRKQIVRISFVPDIPIPTKIPRKKIFGLGKKKRVGVRSVVYDNRGYVGNCIQVDSEDGIYLIGKNLIPTHNSHCLTFLGANAIRQGASVFHYAFGDMNEWEVLVRYAANFSGVSSKDIFHGTGPDYVSAITEWLGSKTQGELIISCHPADTITSSMLRSHISMTITKTGIHPSVIIVDYADNLSTGMPYTVNSAERSAQMGIVYQQLLKIAYQFDAVVWTGSQVGRDHWSDDVIDNSAVSSSVKKIEHADYILTLNQTKEENALGEARIYEAKIRFGEDKNVIPIRFDKRISTLSERNPSSEKTLRRKKSIAIRTSADEEEEPGIEAKEVELTPEEDKRRRGLQKILKEKGVKV